MRAARPAVTALLALVAAVASLAACGVPTEDEARFEDPGAVPFELLDPATTTTTPTSTPSGADTTELCFVRDDLLVPTPRAAAGDLTLTELVEALGAGPGDDDLADGLTTAVPEDPLADEITASSGIANVDLARRFADTEARRQTLAVAQIVCTLTSRPGVGQVSFTLDGEPVAVPRGDGSTTSDPVSREDYQVLGLGVP